MMPCSLVCLALLGSASGAALRGPAITESDYGKLRESVFEAQAFKLQVYSRCEGKTEHEQCVQRVSDGLFCHLLYRSHPGMAHSHCEAPGAASGKGSSEAPRALVAGGNSSRKSANVSAAAKNASNKASPAKAPTLAAAPKNTSRHAKNQTALVQVTNLRRRRAPEDDLAKEMTHDLEMNFNKIAPFGKEDTARELQDHAAKTQDTLVDAVENAEVAEIKRAVFRALTRLRAATIKEFDTIARLETQAIDAYNDAHHYRAENPLAHLHEDEAPVETDKLKSFH
jgi:hypothetical protein